MGNNIIVWVQIFISLLAENKRDFYIRLQKVQ